MIEESKNSYCDYFIFAEEGIGAAAGAVDSIPAKAAGVAAFDELCCFRDFSVVISFKAFAEQNL